MFNGVSVSGFITVFLVGCIVGAVFIFCIMPMIANGGNMNENSLNAEKAPPVPCGVSEASRAAIVQIQEDALKAAGLPTDVSQIIGRKFAFCYGSCGIVLGTIMGFELLENREVILWVSTSSVKKTTIQYLQFVRSGPPGDNRLGGWWAIAKPEIMVTGGCSSKYYPDDIIGNLILL